MIELVLTLNDRSGTYSQHVGVVLASIFSSTQQPINVHILHDETLSEDSKLKLTQLTEKFHHSIHFYMMSIPEDMAEVSAHVDHIEHWTGASMYRLLLPNIIQTERAIYLDCDVWINMDINELWSVDLGDHYLGAVLDQGMNMDEYFTSVGLNGSIYFNSGVILFHLDNIRNHKPDWYSEMLHYLRTYPMTTMPDQDVLNFLYSPKYLQLDQRFNTFAHAGLDPANKVVHFAGDDNKWWKDDSPSVALYRSFLAMTPFEAVSSAPAANLLTMPPSTNPLSPVPAAFLPAVPAPVRRKRRRHRSLRVRLRQGLRKKRIIGGGSRSLRRARRMKRRSLLRRKRLQYVVRKVRKKSVSVIR